MNWKTSGIAALKIGERYVPLRTVWLKDKWGQRRRYRIQTIQSIKQNRTRFNPAWSQLARDERGIIGALISPAYYTGWLKIGRAKKLSPYIFVPLDALPKKVRKKLLIPLDYELIEEDGNILAKEKNCFNFYVGSKSSNLFHEPGCWQAKRIKETRKIIFETKQKALEAGYTAHKVCGG